MPQIINNRTMNHGFFFLQIGISEYGLVVGSFSWFVVYQDCMLSLIFSELSGGPEYQ